MNNKELPVFDLYFTIVCIIYRNHNNYYYLKDILNMKFIPSLSTDQ